MDFMEPNVVPDLLLHFMKCCYRFLNVDWPHTPRDSTPDQGFEAGFRAACVCQLTGWTISHPREMSLGQDPATASGLDAACVASAAASVSAPDVTDGIDGAL